VPAAPLEMPGHGIAHDAQADECDSGHACLPVEKGNMVRSLACAAYKAARGGRNDASTECARRAFFVA
jgi:hypothetical protein